MTRRLTLEWPDRRPFGDRDGEPVRILAVSDVLEPALNDRRNKEAMGSLDLILGCGDLDFDDLAYVADSFDAPLLYVRGNHDTGERWRRSSGTCPVPMASSTVMKANGLCIGGLSWPGVHDRESGRSESGAWRQAIALAARRVGHAEPLLVISHVPPAGVGDVPTDAYHRGFSGYAWLLRTLQPRLWLHGHTPLASTPDWHLRAGPTDVINVTGAVLIELVPPRLPANEAHDRDNGRAAEMTEAPSDGESTPARSVTPERWGAVRRGGRLAT